MPVYEELPLEEPFPRDYEVEWLVDMPNSNALKRFEFGSGPSGPILRIKSVTSERFIATVSGEVSTLRLTTWPDPDVLFALPSAWLINTRQPKASFQPTGFGGHTVHYTFPIPKMDVILIGHCCGIYCYGKAGLLWGREDLFCCEDPVIDLAGDTLILLAHKHGVDPGEAPVRKTLHLMTGVAR